jgi:ACR3 family arsenite efflux pump ArsB
MSKNDASHLGIFTLLKIKLLVDTKTIRINDHFQCDPHHPNITLLLQDMLTAPMVKIDCERIKQYSDRELEAKLKTNL